MRLKSSFVCQQCGAQTPQWYGRCPSCDAWGSLVETVEEVAPKGKGKASSRKGAYPYATAKKLADIRHIETERIKSNIEEFDRAVGGGIVPGSVTLLAGDPGIGKSTLLLTVIGAIGGMYVTGEESAEQIQLRSKRLGINGEKVSVLSENVLEGITEALEKWAQESKLVKNSIVIIDSIQTLASEDLSGMAGTVGQIRYCAEQLVAFAKRTGIPVIIVGHVTKEGEIAGPKVLEHMVDTVLYLEGQRYANARILRTLKNRYGAVEEVGIFEMDDKGLKEISNPSEIFLHDRVKNVPGSVVTVILEGSRPLLVEIQALAVSSQLAMPRRVANGIDYNRLQLLVAVLQRRLGIGLGSYDVFVNVSGGLKIIEPGADAAVALAIMSSYANKAIAPTTAVFGEVGLLGEIRGVGYEERRTKEAKRLGFVYEKSLSLKALQKRLLS